MGKYINYHSVICIYQLNIWSIELRKEFLYSLEIKGVY